MVASHESLVAKGVTPVGRGPFAVGTRKAPKSTKADLERSAVSFDFVPYFQNIKREGLKVS